MGCTGAAWRAVGHNLFADTLKSPGIRVAPPVRACLATLEWDGLACELCSREDGPDAMEAAAVYGGLHLSFLRRGDGRLRCVPRQLLRNQA
ncbi:hypothetical protein GCM10027038_01950 [Arthrobacter bambusae]